MKERTCSECEAPAKVRGMCRKHYARWYKSPEGRETPKVMGRPRVEKRECAYPGCAANARTLEMCWTHSGRLRRYGRVDNITIEEKFFRHVTEDANGGCWIFDSVKKTNGYGQFSEGRKPWLAHRWAYTFMVGDIPEGLTLDHLCYVPACVNPYHLDPVPIGVNISRANERRARLGAS